MPVRVKSTGLVYFPVPKIACSSIKYAILNNNESGLADRLPVRLPLRGKIKNTHMYYPSRPFRSWYPLVYGFKKWFCIVRDPLQRFMSGYSNRIIRHRDLEKTKSAAALRKWGLNANPELDEFVENLDYYLKASIDTKHHFRPICDYLGDNPQRYYRIFRFGELAKLEHFLAAEGAEVNLPHLQAGGKALSVKELSPSGRNKLLEFYSDDYRIWGKFF